MTFIKPKNNSNLINITLILMIALVFGGAWGVIALNNKIVDLNHSVSIIKNNLVKLEAENTESRVKILSLLDKLSAQNLVAVENGFLIQEKSPQYFKIDKKWLFASQY